jgi:hypothetical protein
MDNKDGFNATCITLLQQFRQQLKESWQQKRSEKKNIEECFLLSNANWEAVRALITKHVYDNVKDEIYFFRHIKPGFTAEIEFYSLLYQAHMFKPDISWQIGPFWLREEKRLEEYADLHSEFCEYYRCGKTDNDVKYFTRRGKLHFPVSRLYIEDADSATGYDQVVAGIIAQERYRRFVMERIKELEARQPKNKTPK